MNLLRQLWRMLTMARKAGGPRQLIMDAPKYGALLVRLLRDSRVPAWPKALFFGGIVFAFSPLNIPGWIPVIGQLDDIAIALFVINLLFKQTPAALMAEHRRAVGLDLTPALD